MLFRSTYTIDAEQHVVRTTATGILTDEDVMVHRKAMTADPEFSAGMRELSDIRQVSDFRLTPSGVRLMVASDVTMLKTGGMHQLAIIATDNVAYGMSRMYQTLGEPNIRSVGVFREYQEAAEWLGIS
mgnify:CR=1 FL=1